MWKWHIFLSEFESLFCIGEKSVYKANLTCMFWWMKTNAQIASVLTTNLRVISDSFENTCSPEDNKCDVWALAFDLELVRCSHLPLGCHFTHILWVRWSPRVRLPGQWLALWALLAEVWGIEALFRVHWVGVGFLIYLLLTFTFQLTGGICYGLKYSNFCAGHGCVSSLPRLQGKNSTWCVQIEQKIALATRVMKWWGMDLGLLIC